jgi:hypothetical protein
MFTVQVLLPVEIGESTFADAEPVQGPSTRSSSGSSTGSSSGSSGNKRRLRRSLQQQGGGDTIDSPSTSGAMGSAGVQSNTSPSPSPSSSSSSSDQQQPRGNWRQPKVNSLLALPGADAYAIVVGAAFQSVTDVHLQRPPLSTPGGQLAQQGR